MLDRQIIAEPLSSGSICSQALVALATLLPEGDTSPEGAFLRERCDAAASKQNGSHGNPIDVSLIILGSQLGLHRIEMMAAALAAAVEMDLMCGRAIAHLQAPVGGSRPTLGLLAAAFAGVESDEPVIERILTGAAVESGLLHLLNDNAPLAERALAVPIALCLALSGRDASWPATALGLGGVPETPLPFSVVTESRRQARALAAGTGSVLILRSSAAAEARTIAGEIASALKRRPLFVELERLSNQPKSASALRGLGSLLLLRGLLPVFCLDPGPGERRAIPSIPGYCGPALVVCGRDGSIEARGESPLVWNIGVPPREERTHLWQKAIAHQPLAEHMAADYRHGSGRIAELGRLVRQRCLLEGRAEPLFNDVAAASWIGQGPGFETLAQPLPDLIPDEALVAGAQLTGELSRLLLRCCRRESLIEGLGASAVARYRPGVRVLFTGQSGTGKTLAAGWLATQLGLPLYRADLAAITSKYIGETEKNLAQLLTHAEESGVILLFDEADSLFGKRTEVKESNDRFANAQTNYLLQRIETFDGIALLTSNSRSRFDPAFCRRLDMIIEFPLPGPEERRLLWLSHLGTRHKLTHRELNQLAAAADLAGGHIRNAVLTAAVLAQAKGRAIEYADIYVGLSDEYRKLGRQIPSELVRAS
jgi:hypothetical protein